MPKNLIVCCDGTNNQFSTNNTNVVRLVQSLDRDPGRQRVYYDPGVGTFPEPGWKTWIGKWVSDIGGLAFGLGFDRKVTEAYSFLMNNWEPEDKVFLFGFSRGAYAVRVLAGLFYELGLLPHGMDNLIPYALRLFKTAKRDHRLGIKKADSNYWPLRDEFRQTFSRAVYSSDYERRFPIHFLGVWDTVSSVGWVWDPPDYPFSTHNAGVGIFRHAVSVDERRWFFQQDLMEPITPPPSQDFAQRWFPGVHCDVGGGYPTSEGGLWKESFWWMLQEAKKSGLAIDDLRVADRLGPDPANTHHWNEPKHESLKWYWWPAEFFPKLRNTSFFGLPCPVWGCGHHRHIDDGAVLDRSVLNRLRESAYRPPNISERFVREVLQLDAVPDEMVYVA